MMAERHPQRNPRANQAGNAEECTSSAHSSLPLRRSGRFFATTVLASFVLNEIWEMAQMSAYVETAGYSWTSTLGFCTRAAVGDVGIILGIYAAGALAAGDLGWGLRGRWNITPRRLFWGWLLRRWWNMRPWPPGAGLTRSACP
jgi:hypothetical protein